jgi:hypothetical protein
MKSVGKEYVRFSPKLPNVGETLSQLLASPWNICTTTSRGVDIKTAAEAARFNPKVHYSHAIIWDRPLLVFLLLGL